MIKKLFFIFLMLSACNCILSAPEQDNDMTELLFDYDDPNDGYDDICKTIPIKPVPAWRATLNSIGTRMLGCCLTVKRSCVKYTKQALKQTSAYLSDLRQRLGI